MRHELLKLVSGSAFVFACRLGGALIVFATQVYLARWMGAKELGIYVFSFSLCVLLSTFTGLGYPAASLRVIGHNLAQNKPGNIRGFIRQSWWIITVGSVLAGIVGTGLITTFEESIPAGYAMPMMVLMLCLPVFSLLRVNLRIAHAMSWFKLAFLPNMVIRPLLFFLIAFAAWRSGMDLAADVTMFLHFIAMSLATIGQFVLLRPLLNRTLRDVEPVYETHEWRRTAAPLLLITLFTQFFPEISVALVGTMLAPDQIAIYNAGFRTALFLGFGLAAINAIITPRISRLYSEDKREDLQRLVAITTQLRFWSGLGALLVLVLFGESILSLFGEEFIAGYTALIILALSQLVLAATGPVDVLLSVTGHQNRCLPVFTVALVMTVLLNLVLVPRFGINGAAVSVLMVTIFWASWLHMMVVRHIGIQPSIAAIRHAFSRP